MHDKCGQQLLFHIREFIVQTVPAIKTSHDTTKSLRFTASLNQPNQRHPALIITPDSGDWFQCCVTTLKSKFSDCKSLASYYKSRAAAKTHKQPASLTCHFSQTKKKYSIWIWKISKASTNFSQNITAVRRDRLPVLLLMWSWSLTKSHSRVWYDGSQCIWMLSH